MRSFMALCTTLGLAAGCAQRLVVPPDPSGNRSNAQIAFGSSRADQAERINRYDPLDSLDIARRGRPLIVIIHGRSQDPDKPRTTQKEWFDALAAGQRSIHNTTFTVDLESSADVRWVWYEDLVELSHASRFPDNDNSCSSARERYAPTDFPDQRTVAPPPFRGGMHQFGVFRADSVSRSDSIMGVPMLGWSADRIENNRENTHVPYEGDMLGTFIRNAVDVADRIPGLGDALLGGLLKDTYVYLSDGIRRCAARQRLQRVVEEARAHGRPVVLLAHSMGTLVSFDLLNQRNSPGDRYLVHTYITMGSQLGWAPVLRALIGEFQGDSAPVPISIRNWVNVRNQRDLISSHIRSRMTPPVEPTEFNHVEIWSERSTVFPFERANLRPVPVDTQRALVLGSLPREVRIAAPVPARQSKKLNSGHDARLYLSDPTVAGAIAAAWCKAYEPRAARPYDCTRLDSLDVRHEQYAWSGVVPPDSLAARKPDSGQPVRLAASPKETVIRLGAQIALVLGVFLIH